MKELMFVTIWFVLVIGTAFVFFAMWSIMMSFILWDITPFIDFATIITNMELFTLLRAILVVCILIILGFLYFPFEERE